jgi:hypothetical protein
VSDPQLPDLVLSSLMDVRDTVYCIPNQCRPGRRCKHRSQRLRHILCTAHAMQRILAESIRKTLRIGSLEEGG